MHSRNLLILSAVFYSFTTPALAENKQKADIKEATVFLNGAELLSTAKVNLPPGETEVVFTNIAGNINQKSLNVGADNDVVVKSATFRNDYLADNNTSERAQEIKDSIEYLQAGLELTSIKVQTINKQIEVIEENKGVSAEKGTTADELQKMLNLVRENISKLLLERNAINIETRKTNERVQLLNRQLAEEAKKGVQPGGRLIVKFYTKKVTNCNVTISYVVTTAGWVPSYDLRVDEVNGPVKLTYKAHVYQNTGVVWDKVKLSLSTGNPSESVEAPAIATWYLGFYNPKPVVYSNNAKQGNTGARQVTEIETMATRNTSSMVSISAGSYNQQDGGSVSMSGARSDGTLYIIDGVQVYGSRGINLPSGEADNRPAMNNYVITDNKGVNSVFEIDLPYTIPTDGQQVNVEVKTASLPATYRYYAVPKLDKDAFLQAQVTGWEALNLLPAQTNVFYEGTYVGQGYIDVRNLKDTMNLSLGRDKKIVVSRERDLKLRSVKNVGNNVRETFIYKISVRNTRNKPIDIVLTDQQPVSTDKSIEVSDKENEGAEYNETNGAVTWRLQMAPNETKAHLLGYTVKYPKWRQVNL